MFAIYGSRGTDYFLPGIFLFISPIQQVEAVHILSLSTTF